MGLAEEMRDMGSDEYMELYENLKTTSCEKENAKNKNDDKVETPIRRCSYGPGIGKNFQTKLEIVDILTNTNNAVYFVTMSNFPSDFGEYYFLRREYDGQKIEISEFFINQEHDFSNRFIEFQIHLKGHEEDNYCDMCHETWLVDALNEIILLLVKNNNDNINTNVYIEGPMSCVQRELINDFTTAIIENNCNIVLITPCGMKKL